VKTDVIDHSYAARAAASTALPQRRWRRRLALGLVMLAVGGGLAANSHLRQALERMASNRDVELFIPPLNLCTDNAAMAAIAVEKWRKKSWAPLDLDAIPAYQ